MEGNRLFQPLKNVPILEQITKNSLVTEALRSVTPQIPSCNVSLKTGGQGSYLTEEQTNTGSKGLAKNHMAG